MGIIPMIARGTDSRFSRSAVVRKLHGQDAHATAFLEKHSDLAQNGSSKIRCVLACHIT
jgi:hypothetical protein